MACLTLFTLANFLKALATKLLSSAFYRRAQRRARRTACVLLRPLRGAPGVLLF